MHSAVGHWCFSLSWRGAPDTLECGVQLWLSIQDVHQRHRNRLLMSSARHLLVSTRKKTQFGRFSCAPRGLASAIHFYADTHSLVRIVVVVDVVVVVVWMDEMNKPRDGLYHYCIHGYASMYPPYIDTEYCSDFHSQQQEQEQQPWILLYNFYLIVYSSSWLYVFDCLVLRV